MTLKVDIDLESADRFMVYTHWLTERDNWVTLKCMFMVLNILLK